MSTQAFSIAQVGSEPDRAPVGYSSFGDGYPYLSTRFMYPFVRFYLTEKNEGITVSRNEEGSDYEANVPSRWSVGKTRGLIHFDPKRKGGLPPPMTAEISGTMADHDIMITLRGATEAHSFKRNFNDRSMDGWVQLPKAVSVKATGASRPSSIQASSVPATRPSIGDQINVSLIRQEIAHDSMSYRVTLMAEFPLPDGQGRRKAFYYFIAAKKIGSDLYWMKTQICEDRQPVGSGPGEEPGLNPIVNLPANTNGKK